MHQLARSGRPFWLVGAGCWLIAWLMAASGYAQVGQWTAHTSMRAVVAVDASDEALWAATEGGVFRRTFAGGEVQRFTAVEALSNVQTQAIAYDERRNLVWIGYRDGVIDRLDVEAGTVHTFRDIARADQFSSREINRLKVRGDSLLVATGFGLVVFDPVRGEVRDTYSQLGTFPSATAVRDVIVAPLPEGERGFWLATERGIAYAPLQAVNLQDPSVWTVEEVGGSSLPVRSLAAFRERIYLGTEEGLYVREADGSFQNVSGVSSRVIPSLAVTPERLLAIDAFRLFLVEANGSVHRIEGGFSDLTDLVQEADGNLWMGDRQTGLIALDDVDPSTMPEVLFSGFPAGPFDGQFESLTVDDEGNLWAGGVEDAPDLGFYKRDPEGQWTNYTQRFFEELDGRDRFATIHVDRDGNTWAGSFGDGLAQVTPEGDILTYDRTNSSLLSDAGPNSDFIVVGGIASDADGQLWVANRAAPRPLHVRDAEGTWTGLFPPQCEGLASPASVLGSAFVDSFENKWIFVISEGNFEVTRGLLVLDTADTPTEQSDDTCRFIGTVGNGRDLPSTALTAIAEDRSGRIWIGTAQGLAYILSSSVVAQDATGTPIWPQRADRQAGENPFLLFGLHVNDIAVDPANRLWIATNDGVHLIQDAENGFERVRRFTAENSPLFSNIVVAVTVDALTGEVYFSTDRGLVSFRGDAVAPAEQARDLLVYPNPVRVADGTTPEIFIEGLVEETEVRILAPHGEVVTRLSTRGGRVRWNGRDASQRLVPSGVYLVVAVGDSGEGVAYGKVAIIR